MYRSHEHEHPFPVGKRDPVRAAPDGVHPDLIALLEAEPAVISYEIAPGGMVDVRYWAGRVLVGTLPRPGPDRARIEATKRDRERAGRRVVLVPEARLSRRPYRDNRRVIADASGTGLRPDERLRVLDAVDEEGSATLGDLVRMLGTDRAAAGILALVAAGVLRIDLVRPIDGGSVVRRFEPLR